MKPHLFHYNAETCQYERARPGVKDVILYCVTLLIVATLFLGCMLFVHNGVVTTAREKQLRFENAALQQHKDGLKKELQSIEATLTDLKKKDKDLYHRLFNSQQEESSHTFEPSISKEQVLLADGAAFHSWLTFLSDKSNQLRYKTSQHKEVLHDALHLDKVNVELLMKLPSIQPVENESMDKLVSGFGQRINPFHKGMYPHPGVDFAAARGANVFVTGHGVVAEVRRSQVEAGYGNYIEVDHGHGIVTRYAHLQDILVKTGQRVTKGMTIGTVGSSGGSTAPHVHYEVIRDGEPVDPCLYFLEGLNSSEYALLLQRSRKQNQSLD
jgi:murein DD-endopeptidase MepM/ murein hydrolase activator NlpD